MLHVCMQRSMPGGSNLFAAHRAHRGSRHAHISMPHPARGWYRLDTKDKNRPKLSKGHAGLQLRAQLAHHVHSLGSRCSLKVSLICDWGMRVHAGLFWGLLGE